MLGAFLVIVITLLYLILILFLVTSGAQEILIFVRSSICLSLNRALNPHVSGSDLLAARSSLSKKL